MAHGRGGYRPGAGRKKGSKGKHPQGFRPALQAYCDALGVDPHKFMADLIANSETVCLGVTADGERIMGPAVKIDLKFHAAKELAQYLEPKLKSMEVEHSMNQEKPLRIIIRRGS